MRRKENVIQARRKRGDWGDFSLPTFEQNTLFFSISERKFNLFQPSSSSFLKSFRRPWYAESNCINNKWYKLIQNLEVG